MDYRQKSGWVSEADLPLACWTLCETVVKGAVLAVHDNTKRHSHPDVAVEGFLRRIIDHTVAS